ncbi:MAG TPA: hypothetical protein VHD91_00215 [Gaiellaceae bacterium]|nr:hypothetical protein [Gaiellaceae bacterium]
MKRTVRRIVILLATLVAAFVAASPSLAGMNDGGGFQAAAVTAPAPQPTCGQAIAAAIQAILNGQPVNLGAVISACRP